MKITKWIMGVGLVFALVGCAQAFPTVQAPELPTKVPTLVEQPAEALEVEAQPAVEVTATTESVAIPTTPPETEVASPTEEAVSTIPTETPTEVLSQISGNPAQLGSPDLHATDPSTVRLASGKVQLVEFFAFW